MKKVLCILSDGFEELEAVGTIALLRRCAIPVDVCALNKASAVGRFALHFTELYHLDDIDPTQYDVLFLPGGPHYAQLEADEKVRDIIQSFVQAQKLICAICAAPTILGRMGLLKGKQYTCFTSMNEDFGGAYVDAYAVRDEQLITGRSAAAVIDFAFLIIETLLGKEQAEIAKRSIYY